MSGPIVKWAGGKTKLLPELLARMPSRFGRYYEPFAGGAALFFRVSPERAVLGDENADLIATYRAVAADPVRVAAALAGYRATHSRETYTATRVRWNGPSWVDPEQRAAAFLYLNRTCFNGLWRVNRAGEFNVPIGRYKDPLATVADLVSAAAPALVNAAMRDGDYRDLLRIYEPQPGDFVYFDPPYDGAFAAYTRNGFDDAAQAELAFEVRSLARRGVQVMLSNADTPRVRALYAGLRIDHVRCGRAINSDGEKRGAVNEVIVTAGYEVPAAARDVALNHEIIIETRDHWRGHAWRCTCSRPLSSWMESEATVRAAFRKHEAAARRREREAA